MKLSPTGKVRLLHYHCPNTFRNIPHARVRYINIKILWEAYLLIYTLTDVYLRQTRERLRCPATDIQFQVKRGNFMFDIMQSHIQRCLLKDFSQYGGRRVWKWRHFRLVQKVKKQIQGERKKKRELLKNPTKIEEIQEKKFTDRNWTITTCLLRESNPNYQFLKITSCRWRHPPRMHSFTATTHFKSSLSFVSPSVCCMLCRMRLCQ